MTNKEKDLQRTLAMLNAPPYVDAPFEVIEEILKQRGHGDVIKDIIKDAQKKELYPIQTESFH